MLPDTLYIYTIIIPIVNGYLNPPKIFLEETRFSVVPMKGNFRYGSTRGRVSFADLGRRDRAMRSMHSTSNAECYFCNARNRVRTEETTPFPSPRSVSSSRSLARFYRSGWLSLRRNNRVVSLLTFRVSRSLSFLVKSSCLYI